MIRACLFDLDGTLVDTERENAESIAIVLAARGRPMSDEERRFVVGHGWREIYAHLCEHGGVDLSFPALVEAAAREKERLCERQGLRLIPGAVEYVRRAARLLDGRCALVSGSSRHEVDWAIRTLGLAGEIACSVAAEDVAAGKPSPEGFLRAARSLAAPPGGCLVFEDSAAGIAAGRAAGMRVVAVGAGNFSGEDQGGAHVCVADFMSPAVDDLLDERVWAARSRA